MSQGSSSHSERFSSLSGTPAISRRNLPSIAEEDSLSQTGLETSQDVKIEGLDAEPSATEKNTGLGGVSDRTESPTLFKIAKMVWKEDQLEGTFKGIVPGLFLSLLFARGYISPAPVTFLQSKYTVIPYNLLYIVLLVATYRVIVSPHKIRLSAPKEMFRLIFTEYERRNPLRLFQYSGIAMPFLYGICLDMLVIQKLRDMIGPVDTPFNPPEDIQPSEAYKMILYPIWPELRKIALHLLMPAFFTLILSPVDVIVTRLAVQPVHGPPSASTEERDVEKNSTLMAPPSYLHLTTEQQPYHGFVDCFIRIRSEEGMGTLYRSYWLTFLGIWIPIVR
ncbi:hypothetical protein M413DRAFT_445968 [Hebeloma cylindrosporum]|uniref:Mitochondrial carrier n=1 Tax=Hebeloma cylindrosporum TaxID=76867 RepID=A0A0C2YHG4_HEBCY|nr:hypothetical protein M413DRAFT_445968 [Hebeloma cylindrosporum h7]